MSEKPQEQAGSMRKEVEKQAQSAEHATLDLEVVGLSPTLGVEIT